MNKELDAIWAQLPWRQIMCYRAGLLRVNSICYIILNNVSAMYNDFMYNKQHGVIAKYMIQTS